MTNDSKPCNITLVVTKRTSDREHNFHCDLVGDKGEWTTGDTPYVAIGNWVQTYGEKYGVTVKIIPPLF